MKAALRLLLFVTVLCFLDRLQAQSNPPRQALVMGVGDYAGATYKGKTIPNLPGITTADLPHMAAKLEALGFSVTVVTNPSLSEAKTAVDAFSARIKAAPGVSLFYFSGHGGEYEGKNYLIPKKASIGSKADLADEALNAQRVLNGMEESGAQVNLVFLDCCREDLGKNISGAEMQPMRAKGSFIGFATRSGDFADPGADKEGSPYTRFLLKHLDKPGLSVANMYGYVVRDVKDYTKQILGEERRPGFYSELEGEPFYFVPVKFTPPSTATPAMAGNMPSPSVPSIPVPLASGGPVWDQGAVGTGIQVWLPGDVLMKFAFCPPGSFTMGSPQSEKQRAEDEDQVQVRISKGFWMGRTEVTQRQWTALMSSNPSQFTGDELPVEKVSWDEAQEFISKLNQNLAPPAGWVYALPTEAQWEYACRAGTENAYSFGDDASQLYVHGNFADKNCTVVNWGDKKQDDGVADTTAKVGSYPANKWGLYDMHGNVWEWCADWKAVTLPGGTDPAGSLTGTSRVNRGGSWASFVSFCRAAFRMDNESEYRNGAVGFRPVIVPSR